jgi:oligosaccharide reducing-end xylanase
MIKMDINIQTANDDANTQAGFTKFTIASSGSEVNGVAIDFSGSLSQARRNEPNGTWFEFPPGTWTYWPRAGEKLYRDFIFGIQPSGVTITLWGLGTNRDCNITIWAYDFQADANRVANWSANGTHIFDTNFKGGVTGLPRDEDEHPEDLYKYAFKGRGTTDNLGRIVLTSTRGPYSPESQPFAFVNAIKVEPNVLVPFVPTKYAHRPVPFNGAEDAPADTTLEWKKGGYAEKHDVYLGTDKAKVTDANRSNPLGVLVSLNQSTTTYDPPEFLDFNTTYYWRIDEVNAAPDYTIFKGEVWSFTTYVPVLIACNPVPLDGAGGVLADVTLSWKKGEYAEKHDVYFGTNEAKVTDANRSNPLGVLVSQDHSTTTYDPPEFLDSDTTYYWRIDEVNATPDYTIFKGEVWSFTTYHVASSRTITPPYEVGTWRGFKTAAVSYTFDDSTPRQYSIAIPMFNESQFGFKLTMYPVINWGPNWIALQNAAAVGHEVGSHTMSHPDLGSLDEAGRTVELVNSQNAVNSYIPGQQCDTLAYPNCSAASYTQATTALYYIAGRGCQGFIEGNTPANFYEISSIVCGSSGLNSPADFNSKFVDTAASQGWCVFLIHAIDSDDGYSPLSSATLRSSLEYLNAHRSTFWVQTFRNVVCYIRERNDVSVTELSNEGTTITLHVTDTLNDANYNYPITLRRPLPVGWASASASQNGQPVDVCSVVIGSTEYIMFDVVPDGGDVVLLGAYGDFTGDGKVDMNDLAVFRTYWLVDDCDETAEVDLDGDCLVNFYEYAFLAKNWLLQAP